MSQEKQRLWAGIPVPPGQMVEYLKQALKPEALSGYQHYLFALPGVQRPYEVFFNLRLIWFFHVESPIEVEAAWDGAMGKRQIHSGDIFIEGSNAMHRLKTKDASFSSFTIAFHTQHIRLLYNETEHSVRLKQPYTHTDGPASGALLHLTKALDITMHETGSPRQERCRPLLEAILRQLLFELTEMSDGASPSVPPLALRIKDTMEHKYHLPINCSGICEALNINRTYASGLFHNAFGMSMKEYLLQLRMEAATELLDSEEHLSVERIASYCGFTDASYFIKVFRIHYGTTPEAFRKRRHE